MILQNIIRKIKVSIILCGVCAMFFGLLGCDAFVRKFTRKPKKDLRSKEEMLLAPEEYKGPEMTKEELYRQNFLFWKSWQDELITSLSQNGNHKKEIDCANEAIKSLVNLKSLLNQSKQKQLGDYVRQLTDLKDLIAKDIYGSSVNNNRQNAERIKRNILRDFSYKSELIQR